MLEVLTSVIVLSEDRLLNAFRLGEGSVLQWPKLALAALLIVLTNWVKPVKDWHPIVFIALSAAVGILFGFSVL
jgi:chromate transporter